MRHGVCPIRSVSLTHHLTTHHPPPECAQLSMCVFRARTLTVQRAPLIRNNTRDVKINTPSALASDRHPTHARTHARAERRSDHRPTTRTAAAPTHIQAAQPRPARPNQFVYSCVCVALHESAPSPRRQLSSLALCRTRASHAHAAPFTTITQIHSATHAHTIASARRYVLEGTPGPASHTPTRTHARARTILGKSGRRTRRTEVSIYRVTRFGFIDPEYGSRVEGGISVVL